MDISLDTFPYAGTTTTCESLFMGVPVITLAGTTHAQNVGKSILTAIGYTQLIAESTQAFVDIAQRLVSDFHSLSQMRQRIRDAMTQSVLCDGVRYTKHLECEFVNMVTNFWKGIPEGKKAAVDAADPSPSPSTSSTAPSPNATKTSASSTTSHSTTASEASRSLSADSASKTGSPTLNSSHVHSGNAEGGFPSTTGNPVFSARNEAPSAGSSAFNTKNSSIASSASSASAAVANNGHDSNMGLGNPTHTTSSPGNPVFTAEYTASRTGTLPPLTPVLTIIIILTLNPLLPCSCSTSHSFWEYSC